MEFLDYKTMCKQTMPCVGFTTVRGYKQTDMGQARISSHGQGKNKDRTEKEHFGITVPVLHKEFTLWWRDLELIRPTGCPLIHKMLKTLLDKLQKRKISSC